LRVLPLRWFDPEGADLDRSIRELSPALPVLWMAARDDYPGLRRTMLPAFAQLPAHASTQLYEPDSTHLGAPAATIAKIARWTAAIAGAKP